MSATTLKIESPLLDELKKICPKQKSISAFVRSILEQIIQKQKMANAIQCYQEFLTRNPQEAEWLNEWESADLAAKPKSRKKS